MTKVADELKKERKKDYLLLTRDEISCNMFGSK